MYVYYMLLLAARSHYLRPSRQLLRLPAPRLGGLLAHRSTWRGDGPLSVPEEMLQARKGERKDSVDDLTLHDRAMHEFRMQRAPPDPVIFKEIQRLSLGRFKVRAALLIPEDQRAGSDVVPWLTACAPLEQGWHKQRAVTTRRERAAKLLASRPAVLGRRGVLIDYQELSVRCLPPSPPTVG